MRETAASGVEAPGFYRSVGIPVVEGFAAFHRGAYDQTVEPLQARFELWQIGGSHRNVTSETASVFTDISLM